MVDCDDFDSLLEIDLELNAEKENDKFFNSVVENSDLKLSHKRKYFDKIQSIVTLLFII